MPNPYQPPREVNAKVEQVAATRKSRYWFFGGAIAGLVIGWGIAGYLPRRNPSPNDPDGIIFNTVLSAIVGLLAGFLVGVIAEVAATKKARREAQEEQSPMNSQPKRRWQFVLRALIGVTMVAAVISAVTGYLGLAAVMISIYGIVVLYLAKAGLNAKQP